MLTSIPRFSALVFSNFIMRTIALFIFASATLLSAKAIAKESLHFQKGDIVAIYGNGLADRMQHAPWVETLLQTPTARHGSSLPKHELFRRYG